MKNDLKEQTEIEKELVAYNKKGTRQKDILCSQATNISLQHDITPREAIKLLMQTRIVYRELVEEAKGTNVVYDPKA